jgi:formate--tetrahydrofolate ligase
LEDSLEEKIAKVAKRVYGAAGVALSEMATAKLEQFAAWGFGKLPICIAKTQYSLSDNPKFSGAHEDWTLHVSDVALSAGAGFVVAIAGNMMLMPGLPKLPRALSIDVNDDGEIIGV